MNIRSSSLAFVLAATLAATGALSARAQSQADPVLARVDGVEIRQSDLALAEADIGSNLPPTAAEARRDALVSYLVDVTILAKAAEAKKLANGPDFANRLAYARKKVLMEALLEQESKNSATEAEKRKLYDESIKKLAPEQEVHARHILVETEDKAKEVLGKLKAGGDFAALAKEVSKDPGASDGGDLGYFSKEQMVPEFAEAAFKLDKGKISDPVKTQFGWHIIKVEDKRQRPVPTYDQVKDQIEAFVARKAQAELVVKLREASKIERLTPKAETPAQPAPAAGKQKK
jgi:peptidyl-prolyl cis-trans isomerase C